MQFQKLIIIMLRKQLKEVLMTNQTEQSLKSDSFVSENFCQIKIFPNLVRKNTIICLFGI